MEVRVDQAGHQQVPAAAVDDPRVGWAGRSGPMALIRSPLDQHVDGTGHRAVARGVVDQHAAEQHGHGGPSR